MHKGNNYSVTDPQGKTFRKDDTGSPGAVPKLQRQENPRPPPRQEPPFGKIDMSNEDRYAFFSMPAYFFLNRSTRPAVSTIFCFPVMNG
jgi:hypothetical protein